MESQVTVLQNKPHYGDLDFRRELTRGLLEQQTLKYRNTGGTSAEAGSVGFEPAFLDCNTGRSYRACFANGMPAPVHVLDGLPGELVVARDSSGRITAVKESVIAGFIRYDRFYTRAQAARIVLPAAGGSPLGTSDLEPRSKCAALSFKEESSPSASGT